MRLRLPQTGTRQTVTPRDTVLHTNTREAPRISHNPAGCETVLYAVFNPHRPCCTFGGRSGFSLWRRGMQALVLLLVGLGAPLHLPDTRSARADDFFSVEPKERIKGHQNMDCKKCHSEGGGGGIDRNKCLGCHDHRDLKKEIEEKRGLHSLPEFSRNCEKCHADHKGPTARIIDWRMFGGMDAFPHEKTGYDLQGAHRRASCTDCHKDKFQKSGTPRMLGLEQKCLSCHEDVHKFGQTRKELMECSVCHTYDARSITSAVQVQRTFNHARVADFALRGAHDDIKCTTCHPGGKVFKMDVRPKGCVSCHKDIHKNIYTAEGRSCDKCHLEDKSNWRDTRFDHDKTNFPLTFRHQRASCQKCHPANVVPKPGVECLSCHKKDDVHIVGGVDRFEKVACQKCHTPSGFTSRVHFSHGTETGMKLQGRHGAVSCTTCHRAKPRKEQRTAEDAFERFTSAACTGCHSHEKAHDRAFHDQPQMCVKCHVPGTDNLRIPPHTLLSQTFKQQGAHAAVNCEKCHGEGIKNLKLGSDCTACHTDKHNGTLGSGADCQKCHTEGFAFRQVSFDHTKDSKFPLVGRHATVSCNKCHQEAPGKYTMTDQRCVACHGAQDVHQRALGESCDKCHTPQGGATRFDHARMTKFPLEGAHARAACVGCHTSPEKGPKGEPQVDWAFRSQGTACSDCHGDRHGVTAAQGCQRCHGTDDWRSRIVDRSHDVQPFSLLGQHNNLECTKCHGDAVDLTGMGTRCESCHKQDDIHGGALRECQQCHRVTGWQPSSFTHATTGFPLQGIHRVLDCRQCHGANNYSGMSAECVSCHLRDFINAKSPVANGFHASVVQDPNCLPCHNQITWQRKPLNRGLP